MKQLSLAVVLGCVTAACATAPKNVKVDKASNQVSIFSNDDPGTAVPQPNATPAFQKTTVGLKEEVKANPQSVKARLNLAQMHLINGKFKESEDIIRDVLRLDLKNKEAKLILATIYQRRGLYEMAATILSGIGAEKSKDSRQLNLLALISLKKGDNQKAMAYFRRAIAASPSDVAVRMNMGVLYLKYRQLNEAATQFERVLKITPGHQDARLHLAVIHASRGQTEKAEEIYEDLLAQKDYNPVALFNYASLAKQTKNYDDALERLKEYIKQANSKSTGTKRAFALIDEIQQVKAAQGESISNEEIQQLASQLDVREQSAPVETAEAQSSPQQKAQEPSAPAPVEQEQPEPARPVTPSGDNIQDLESELMN